MFSDVFYRQDVFKTLSNPAMVKSTKKKYTIATGFFFAFFFTSLFLFFPQKMVLNYQKKKPKSAKFIWIVNWTSKIFFFFLVDCFPYPF